MSPPGMHDGPTHAYTPRIFRREHRYHAVPSHHGVYQGAIQHSQLGGFMTLTSPGLSTVN